MTMGRRYQGLLWGILLCTLVIGARVVGAAQENRPTRGPGGEELYNASCVVCHAANAAGGIGPRLAGNPVLGNEQAFRKIMSEGRHMMPPLKDTLTEQQLGAIRAWLKTLP